ncbi:MAG: 23S rRNA (pseudouridine(1915)-N(3))-methyltransferase RlmH [Gammaproteobacteria bacterium]
MHFRILSILNKSHVWEKEGLSYYAKQLGPQHTLNFIDIACKHPKGTTPDQIRSKECDLLLSKLRNDASVIAWDGRLGKKISSEDLAEFFSSEELSSSNIDFVIGGSHGLSKKLLDHANYIFSASNLTFPHRLFKIILVEQIFRAIKIQENHPYHK